MNNLNLYFKEINKQEVLTQEQEIELFKRIKKGDEKAEEELIVSNLRFVVSVAKTYLNQGLPLSDLIGAGNQGLIRASKRFDGNKKFKFISYAVWWIRQSILKAISQQSRPTSVPSHFSQKIYNIRKIREILQHKLNREPDIEEIAEVAKETLTGITNILGIEKSLSLDTKIDGKSFGNSIPVKDNSDKILDNLLYEDIKGALDSLPEREKLIILMYYGLEDGYPHTLEDIGIRLNLTRERVRQLKKRAERSLKKNHILKNIASLKFNYALP